MTMSGVGKMATSKDALRVYDDLAKRYSEAQGLDALLFGVEVIGAAAKTIDVMRKEVNGETYAPKTITITRQRTITQAMEISTTDSDAYNRLHDLALDGDGEDDWNITSVDIVHRGAKYISGSVMVQNVSALVNEHRKVTFTS